MANFDGPRALFLARHKRASKPVVDELRAHGLNVDYVEDLYHRRLEYEYLMPVLLKWLTKVQDADVKEAIVRALTAKWAKPMAVPALLAEFRAAALEGADSQSLKWAIGNAIDVVGSDEFFDEIADLAMNRIHGKSRQMLVLALGKMRDPRAVDVLVGLLDDADVAGHAVSALRRLAPARARSRIEPFATHPTAWIRNEAKRAIAKIDKRASSEHERAQRGRRR